MQYYSILNFKEEPFSNSPDPSMMYLPRVHHDCMQQLELSIWLRRGLCVVLGDVGLGKTTICRAIIHRLQTPDANQKIVTFLFLDSYFSSAKDFLLSLANMIHKDRDFSNHQETQIKECIKTYLIQSYEQNEIVVLIFDEGQKLSEVVLETIREMLNFETNEHKLLQIIIFAQNEFNDYINKHNNFANRINLLYKLSPLNFFDMRNMILFRIQRAYTEQNVPNFFTFFAMWEIYRITNGYPRLIITLCHHCILALIIKDKHIVTRALVKATYKRGIIVTKPKRQPLPIGLLFLLIVSLSLFFIKDKLGIDFFIPVQSVSDNITIPSDNITIPKVIPSKTVQKPTTLGQLKIKQGDNLITVAKNFYGNAKNDTQHAIKYLNSDIVMQNLYLKRDTNLTLPAIQNMSPQKSYPNYMVKIAEFDDINSAYSFIKIYPSHLPNVAIMPCFKNNKGLFFNIVLRQSFADIQTAESMIVGISPDISQNITVERIYQACDVHYRVWN